MHFEGCHRNLVVGGLDDAAEEEVKTFRTEGDGEERVIENGPASVHQDSYGFAINPDDLNDVKSSLVIEGDPSSLKGANAQRNKRLNGGETYQPPKDGHNKKIRTPSIHEGGEKADYPRFPPFSNLAFFPGNYPSNGAVLSGPGGSKVPMVHPMPPYPSSLAHLMYSSERFPAGTPPPAHLPTSVEIDSKTGILRPRHSPLDLPPYHSLSPSAISQLPHHLDIYPLPSQPFYPTIRSPYPANLLVNSSAISRLAPSTNPSNYRGVPLSPQTSPASQHHDTQQQSNDREKNSEKKTEKKAPPKVHIKKPLNAFMLYMKEMRASVVKECTLKESAAINQILGRRWHALSREEQAKYYELARKERQLHMQLYPGWSARDNYATACRRRKKRKDKTQGDATDPSTPKKCRARFGVDQQDFWCKPCRRKKKCIRFITDENGAHYDEDEDDSDYSGDEGMDKSCTHPAPAKKQCLNAESVEGKNEPSQTLIKEKPRPPSPQSKPEKKEGTAKQSSAALALSVSSLTAQPVRSSPASSSGLSSVNSICHPRSPAVMPHPRSPAVMPHGSPTLIPLPHPATPSHPGMTAGVTSSFMMFPPHSPLLSYSSPSSVPDVYRGPHLVPPPPGLIPVPQFPGGPPSVPPHLRLSGVETPQDLSMKSGAVTA